jgi:hypothetical protein
MADWTANSDFGALGARREPVVRATREAAAPRADGPRAERLAASRPLEEAPRGASAALAEYNAAQDGPLAKARLAVWVGGGAVSLALIAGIGVWGYKLVLREVMGLPVVVAEEGPMRVLPADPGGETVPQQGLAVNAIPAAGTAAPPSDVLMLAPQTPGLAEEDMEVVQTMAEAGEVMPAAPATVATDALAPAEAAPAAAPVAGILPTDRPMTAEEILAFADQIAAQAAPLAAPTSAVAAPAAAALAQAAAPVATVPAAPAPVEAATLEAAVAALVPPEAAPMAEAAAALVAANAPGLAAAIRPLARPAAAPASTAPVESTQTPEAAPAVEAVAAPAEAAPVEATPAAEPAAASGIALTPSLPSGTNLVQLGAFDSPEIAASEWDRLQGAFGEFLGSKERVIQETQNGGRTLYRLRALGFADRADARRLCAALTAEGADCIPVTVD